ncbi:unnamed protein product [Closterium sp. NIES-64]|nr:unnamed protein product [Closterium sp. NIES-64]
MAGSRTRRRERSPSRPHGVRRSPPSRLHSPSPALWPDVARGSRSQASSPRLRSPRGGSPRRRESPRQASPRRTSPRRPSLPPRNQGGGSGQSRSRRAPRRWRAHQPAPAVAAATAAATAATAAATAAVTAAVERALDGLDERVRSLSRPDAPVVPSVSQLPPPLDLAPHPPAVVPPLPLPAPPPILPPQQQLRPQQPLHQQLPPQQLPPHARPDPQSLAGQPDTFAEAGDGCRVELPLYGMPPPPPMLHQQPQAAQTGGPLGSQVLEAGAAAGMVAGVESPPASPTRRSAARRHSGIRVAPRVAVGGLSRRRADVHRVLEVEAHVLARLGHVRSFVAFVGLMIDNAAAALEDVPEELSVMNHAQMRASRDGVWVLQHELERAEMEPDGDPALGAAVADVMRVVESRVRSRSAVDVLRGLSSALRLVDGTTERLLRRAEVS